MLEEAIAAGDSKKAVEALAENCDVMRMSIEQNNLTNIEVLEAAATDKPRKSASRSSNFVALANLSLAG